jgi:hypothetical protein
VLWRQAAGVLVLTRAGDRAAAPLALTGPAPVLWLALDEPATVAELAELLSDALAIDAEDLRADVTTLLDSLGSQGYVETCP